MRFDTIQVIILHFETRDLGLCLAQLGFESRASSLFVIEFLDFVIITLFCSGEGLSHLRLHTLELLDLFAQGDVEV